MPFNESGLNDAVNGVAAAATWISAHTADPGSGGASEVAGGSYARQQTTWGAASGGDRVGSDVPVAIPAGTTVTHWGLWSAETGGTFKGGFALSAPEMFGGAGTLNHTPTLAVDPA
jgi:hypothetical protein